MTFDVYDPAIHGENDWAEVNAANAHEAAVKHMTANADPLDFDPEGIHPILVRASYDDWEALAIGIGRDGDDISAVYYWCARGRWTGRKVTPPSPPEAS